MWLYESDHQLNALGERVSRREPGAEAALRRYLGSQLGRVIRRVLRTEEDTSPLARVILGEARDLGWRDDGWGLDDGLVPLVSRRVCDAVVEQLRGSPVGVPALPEPLRC
jgi:hypothetical protein